MTEDPYDSRDFTRFYDWAYSDLDDDIPFYLEMGNMYGSRIFELGCGSGRITIPLARNGYSVTALDLSAEMLSLARMHSEKEPEHVRNRITYIQEDMSTYRAEQVYDIAFIPYSSIYHLDTVEKKTSCLEGMAGALSENGAAIIDMVNPLIMECQEEGDSFSAKRGVNPYTGIDTVQVYSVLSHDLENQVLEVEHVFLENDVEKYRWQQKFWWLTGPEISSLLRNAGFREIDVFGEYDLTPYNPESERLICAARL